MVRIPAFPSVIASLLVAVLAAALTACSMVETIPIDSSGPVGCASDSGAYYLSKSDVAVVVKRIRRETVATAPAKPKILLHYNKLESVTPKRKADREHGYCLDYVAAATSDDKVYLKKNQNYLLSQISTQGVDQSAYIIKTLINAIFTGIAGIEGANFVRTVTSVKSTRASLSAPSMIRSIPWNRRSSTARSPS